MELWASGLRPCEYSWAMRLNLHGTQGCVIGEGQAGKLYRTMRFHVTLYAGYMNVRTCNAGYKSIKI